MYVHIFPCLRCLPVSTGDGRFIEQSEPHFSEPSRKICYVKNWSYFTLGESRRASFHQHFVCVTLWKREKYKLTRRLNGLNMAGLNLMFLVRLFGSILESWQRNLCVPKLPFEWSWT